VGVLKENNYVKTSEVISTLEALLILTADPRLNARREKLRNAVRLSQSERGRPLSDQEKQLALIQQKLEAILTQTKQKRG
jgi:hypothetical protein